MAADRHKRGNQPAFRRTLLLSFKMTREARSLYALNKTLSRMENKLQRIEAQFTMLDSNILKLSEKLEFHSTTLDHQTQLDEMWISLLEEKFTSVEINLFYSYICETIHYLHSQVVKRLPDLSRALPTLSSVMRQKGKNQRIRLAWESSLEILGLQESDVKALCAFFIKHSYDACYYPTNQREEYTSDICSVINKVVKNELLQHSLLCAVHIVNDRRSKE